MKKEFNILRKNIVNTMIKDISERFYTGTTTKTFNIKKYKNIK